LPIQPFASRVSAAISRTALSSGARFRTPDHQRHRLRDSAGNPGGQEPAVAMDRPEQTEIAEHKRIAIEPAAWRSHAALSTWISTYLVSQCDVQTPQGN